MSYLYFRSILILYLKSIICGAREMTQLSSCCVDMRIWIWIPRSHVKLGLPACVNPNTTRARWEVEAGEFPRSMLDSWLKRLWTATQGRVCLRVEGKGWHPSLSSDLYVHVLAQVCLCSYRNVNEGACATHPYSIDQPLNLKRKPGCLSFFFW